MNIKKTKGNLKKVLVGTIMAVGVCSMGSFAITQSVQAALINRTELIPTVYSLISKENAIPKDYVKAAYKVMLKETVNKPTAKDISASAAAELGAQSLWRIFGVGLAGKTVEMSYNAANSNQPRAVWTGYVKVDKNLSCRFTVDSVTGKFRTISQLKSQNGNIDKALDKDLNKFTDLAKEVSEKYSLVSGKVISSQYMFGSSGSKSSGKNSDITIMVKSDKGQQVKLTFSRYNQELLSVEYDSWLKDSKALEEQAKKEVNVNIKNGETNGTGKVNVSIPTGSVETDHNIKLNTPDKSLIKNNSVEVQVTPPADNTPFTVTGVSAKSELTVEISFSHQLNKASAKKNENYTIQIRGDASTTLPVSKAELDDTGTKVLLTTSIPQAPFSIYDVFVKNIEDIYGNRVADFEQSFGSLGKLKFKVDLSATTRTSIVMACDFKLDKTSAENTSNYYLYNPTEDPHRTVKIPVARAELDSTGTRVKITFVSPLETMIIYDIIMENLTTSKGETLAKEVGSFVVLPEY